ncbi:MAG: glucose-6-phosphate isomerase [Pseudomonadota bacterium]
MTNRDFSARIALLDSHWQRLGNVSMRDMFADQKERFERMSLRLGDLIFDYSKNRIDDRAMVSLLELAHQCGLEEKRNAMLSGEAINATEGRAVMHTALRDLTSDAILIGGKDMKPAIEGVRDTMGNFSDAVRSGEYTVSGNRVADVVNIGIGGSDLGPKMVARALLPFADGPTAHFVSNVDPADIGDTLARIDPATTLFVIASKTFTTQETMANAATAFDWVKSAMGDRAGEHFCAVSTNLEATREFGIADERTFGFWDWVGGRFSVWGAIGLPVMMAIGPDAFADFLKGAHLADQHFASTPIERNIPVIMGLLAIWHRNVCGYGAQAVLPYDNRLSEFPAWLQQLEMESNGKQVSLDGSRFDHETNAVIFGEPGTNGQHAFYQLLHQGTSIMPCDFLVAANPDAYRGEEQHNLLLANCLAQSEALMMGQTLKEADGNPHRVFDGNRPSSTFLYKQLTPHMLGIILALYEHKTFVQGALWGINSFDQYGVELGKQLAKTLEPMINEKRAGSAGDASTRGLLEAIFDFQKS